MRTTTTQKRVIKKPAKGESLEATPMRGRGRPKNVKLNIDVEWVKARMQALGLRSFAELARSLAMDKAVLSKSLAGGRVLTTKDVVALAEVFKVAPDEVMRRFGLEIEPQGVTIVGKVTADGKVSSVSPRKGTIFVPQEHPSQTQALVVEGLAGFDNAVIIYTPMSAGKPVPLSLFGTLCVVEADDHLTPFLGTLGKGTGKGRIALELFGTNTKLEVEQVHVASPVLAIHFT